MPQVEEKKPATFGPWPKIALVLIVLAVSFGVGFWQYRAQLARDRAAVVEAIERSERLVTQAKYTAATEELQSVAPRARTKDEQLELLYRRGAVALVSGDYQGAEKLFRDYEQQGGLTVEIAKQLGWLAEQSGRRDEALEYYRQAVKLVESSDLPNASGEIEGLNARIQQLEAGSAS